LPGGARHCAICGEPVPWRLTPLGVGGETVLAAGLVAAMMVALLFIRARGGPGLADGEQLIASLPDGAPTSAPTFTAMPPPSPSLPPNTPLPPTATPLPRVITYTVESGDTISGIAQQFSVSTDVLVEANADTLENAHSLRIGQQLRVPMQLPAVAEAAPAGEAPAEGAPVAAEPGAGDPAVAGENPEAADPAANGDPPPTEALDPTIAAVLGLPEATGEAAGRSGVEEALETVPNVAGPGSAAAGTVVESERSAAVAFPMPLAVGPATGSTLAVEQPVLRWTSVGPLPAGVHYVVALTKVDGNERSAPELSWILSNATAFRVPGAARPPLGTTRTYEWTVSVRRRSGQLIGADSGELLSPPSEARTFVWAP
jgi:LysM repeat protein